MSDKLLPCPFCGGEAEIDGINNGNPFMVYCDACGLEFGRDKQFYSYQAKEAWNRRAEPDTGITITEKLTCRGCIYFEDDHEFDPCQGCKRLVRVNDYYRQKPKEETE